MSELIIKIKVAVMIPWYSDEVDWEIVAGVDQTVLQFLF